MIPWYWDWTRIYASKTPYVPCANNPDASPAKKSPTPMFLRYLQSTNPLQRSYRQHHYCPPITKASANYDDRVASSPLVLYSFPSSWSRMICSRIAVTCVLSAPGQRSVLRILTIGMLSRQAHASTSGEPGFEREPNARDEYDNQNTEQSKERFLRPLRVGDRFIRRSCVGGDG